MNCILVPTLALDLNLLQRLADSIDYRVQNKLVINNGKAGSLDKWREKNPEWAVLYPGRNLGVSGSWNLAPEQFKEDKWLIINDDIQLLPGSLEKICKAVDENEADVYYVNQYEAFDIFVWTRSAVEKFGLFDENFYPAYFEDWEMRLRFNLGGAKTFVVENNFRVDHGKPFPGGDRYMAMLSDVKPINENYFMRKWGIVGDKNPAFDTPFNINGRPLSYWKIEKERREVLQGIWDMFFSHPRVSLYNHTIG